jgi:4-amino-4-deoxy-L-arabinose transferase-like glycosyltransferase
MRIKQLSDNEKVVQWALFLFAIILCLPLIWLDDIPSRDVAHRYAPMAEAFARGDWEYAFHPRVSMLLPTLAGITAFLTNCNGFTACKLISVSFFALTVFPLYGIMRQVFDKRTAITTTLMMIFCSHIMRLAYSGLRDTAKGFTFVLAIYGLIQLYRNRNALTGYLTCIIGGALLIISRGDCLLYAIFIIVTAFCMELYSKNRFHWPWRATCGSLLALALITPALFYNYKTIGYPVPEVRVGIIMSRMLPFVYNEQATLQLSKAGAQKVKHQQIKSKQPKSNSPKRLPATPALYTDPHINHALDNVQGSTSTTTKNILPITLKKLQRNNRQLIKQTRRRQKLSITGVIMTFISSLIKGFYPYFFLMAIPVIFLRIHYKKWQKEETILLIAVMGHALLLIAQIAIFDHKLYVSRRYLLPVSPLAFGWSAIFIIWIWTYLNKLVPRYANRYTAWIIASLLAALLYLDGAVPAIKNYTNRQKKRERRATMALAAWIKNDYQGERTINRTKVWKSYLSNQRPLVISPELRVLGYMTGGQNLLKSNNIPDYVIIKTTSNNISTSIINAEQGKTFKFDEQRYTIWRISSGGSK